MQEYQNPTLPFAFKIEKQDFLGRSRPKIAPAQNNRDTNAIPTVFFGLLDGQMALYFGDKIIAALLEIVVLVKAGGGRCKQYCLARFRL